MDSTVRTAVKLRVRAAISLSISPGDKGPPPRFVSISVVNHGLRDVTVTNVAWRFGIYPVKEAVQTFPGQPLRNSLPVTLSPGQQTMFMVPLDDSDWLSRMAWNFDSWMPWLSARQLKALIPTTLGVTTLVRVEKSLRDALLKELERMKAAGEKPPE